jgi:hypothetical protein
LTAEHKAELAGLVEAGPDPACHGPARHGVVRWAVWICATSWNGASVSRCTNARSARCWRSSATAGSPSARAIRRATQKPRRRSKNFAATVAARLPDHAKEMPIEIWFQDEARIGQQGTLTRIWAGRGTRPRAPRDQRYEWVYIFGAVCPQHRAAAALVVPTANTEVMSLHLAEIGRQVAPGSHAALVLDGAGYHVAKDLDVPENMTLLSLPPYAPELNPIEIVSEYLRGNKLAIT